MTPALLKEIIAAKQQRQAVAVITDLASGAQRMVARADIAEDPLQQILETGFRFDRSGVHSTAQGEVFVTIHNPALHLVIIGAVLIAQSIIPMAQLAGYDVSVIDPRGAFATDARFPNVKLYADWPQDVLPQLNLDHRTAFMALTHDPKIDDPALHVALKSNVFYIGALGSKKTQLSRRERLLADGFSEAELARIHGPIGMAIGAVGAAEIAFSIMAEMTHSLRVGS
jgi:xanthine dehydrogenase accessory factor